MECVRLMTDKIIKIISFIGQIPSVLFMTYLCSCVAFLFMIYANCFFPFSKAQQKTVGRCSFSFN